MPRIATFLVVASLALVAHAQEKGASPNARNPSAEPMVFVWFSGMDDQAEENYTSKRVNREALALLKELYGRKMSGANLAADSQGGLARFLLEIDGCDYIPRILRGYNVVSIKFFPDGVDPMHIGFMADEALVLPTDLTPEAMRAEIEAYLTRNLIPPPSRTVQVKYRSKMVVAGPGKK